jgi:DnaD/phage-associated family protein
MAAQRIPLPGDSISMSAVMADSLLQKGSGDAALLYLYLLRHDGFYDPEEAGRVLHWERERLDGALLHLSELGLQTGQPKPEFAPAPPKKEEAPAYSQLDLAQAISDKTTDFPYLLEDVQRQLGKTLNDRDTRTLLEVYEHVGLPAEVILMLVNWQCQEYGEKYGEGRRPPMSYIRTAAYRWKNSGVDTLEAAEAYLKKLAYYRTQEGAMLAAVDIRGRKPINDERKHLNQWIEWGFPPETVTIAYEKTVYNTGQFKWNYCTSILRRWHQAGIHTPEEVKTAEAPRRPTGSTATGLVPAKPPTPAQQQADAWELEESQRQMRKLLEQNEN